MGTSPSGHPSPHQAALVNRLGPLKLLPHLRSIDGEPPRWNAAVPLPVPYSNPAKDLIALISTLLGSFL
jgi:hypothetical protein